MKTGNLTTHTLHILTCKLYLLLFVTLFFCSGKVHSQNCTINAGVDQQVCTSSATLTGNQNGNTNGNPAWSFISGPVTPVISTPNSISTAVTGMAIPGDYVFQLSQPCQFGGTVLQTVKITANPSPLFTAGTSFNFFCGNFNSPQVLAASLPAGWTGKWRVSKGAGDVTSLFSFSNINSPTSAVSLATANQNCNFAGLYFFTWEITSPNGICKYSSVVTGTWYSGLPDIDYELGPKNICLPTSQVQFNSIGTSCVNKFIPSNAVYTVLPSTLTAPPGFTGSLSAFSGSLGGLLVTGFTVAGTYTFNVQLDAPPCGSKVFGPFTVNVNSAGQIVTVGSNDADKFICSKSLPASVTFNYTINTPSAVSSITATLPTGADPVVITQSGTGTTSRSFTVTPNTKWKAGIYLFTANLSVTGACSSGSSINFKLIIYDSIPINLNLPDVNVCLPVGIPSIRVLVNLPSLPPAYGMAGGFSLGWKITKLSGTGGIATMFFSTSTTAATPSVYIDFLTAGTYTYQLEPTNPDFINEIACSGGATSGTFRINVFNQAASNAGTNQNIHCIQNFPLAANIPIPPAFGSWSQVAGPTPLQFSNIHDPNATTFNSTLAPMAGTYKFRWTVTDPAGACSVATSDVTIVSNVTCAPVPVTLLFFSANEAGNNILLKWATATEQNTQEFVVEWSTDGANWQNAGIVTAHGNSNDIVNYNFIHRSPAKGINYYRLKQVDIDDHKTYSSIVAVRYENNAGISIFPNPVVQNLYILKLIPGSLIELIAPDGKIVVSKTANTQNEMIDMKNYPKGFYVLKISSSSGNTLSVVKLVKQ